MKPSTGRGAAICSEASCAGPPFPLLEPKSRCGRLSRRDIRLLLLAAEFLASLPAAGIRSLGCCMHTQGLPGFCIHRENLCILLFFPTNLQKTSLVSSISVGDPGKGLLCRSVLRQDTQVGGAGGRKDVVGRRAQQNTSLGNRVARSLRPSILMVTM